MIPSYKEEVKITIQEKSQDQSLEQQVKELQEQVRILRESVDYFNREKSRLKSEIESLKGLLRK
jgi:predicted RNase H-like nuclease (RuvC/YqgF family)